MRPSCVQGEVSSFFWIQAPSYGPLEIDVEFPDPPGHIFNDVHWTIHPSGQTIDYNLGFNPCQAFHRYGFLWTAGKVQFSVDGVTEEMFTDSTLISNVTGFLMANAWTGNPNWGGGPPTQPAVNAYSWMIYSPKATVPKQAVAPDDQALMRGDAVAPGNGSAEGPRSPTRGSRSGR